MLLLTRFFLLEKCGDFLLLGASRSTTFPHLARWAAAIKLQGIEGLKSANELNGTFGTCLNFVTSSGRWAIATEVLPEFVEGVG